ncbi:MAG: hypothetical protein ACXAEN_17660 [Candidatus Thorarchaeota archaeon]|jgi:hypothetical protein
MRFGISLVTLALLAVLALGLVIQPVVAHGDDDDNMTVMPGMPGMPMVSDMGHMPGHMMGNDSVWITTDVITIMATEEMPAFHYWYTNDNNGSMAKFMAAYGMIAEFEDSNSDAAFQFNETLHFAPLAAYEWTLQTGSVMDDDGMTTEVWLKYTKGGIHGIAEDDHGMMHDLPGVPGMPGAPHMYEEGSDIERFENLTIQIWAHIYFEDYNGTVSDSHGVHANYTVAGGTELKIDIEMGNFPFSSETTQVALQTMLNENMGMGHMDEGSHMFRTHEESHNVTGTSMMNWMSDSGNETLFGNVVGTHMQHIDFSDASTNITHGFYKWIDQAVISWPGGETEVVNVSASYVPTGMGLSLFFAYPNFGNGSLLHDPSIGVYEDTGFQVPADLSFLATIGGASIVVVLVAIVIIRRR